MIPSKNVINILKNEIFEIFQNFAEISGNVPKEILEKIQDGLEIRTNILRQVSEIFEVFFGNFLKTVLKQIPNIILEKANFRKNFIEFNPR